MIICHCTAVTLEEIEESFDISDTVEDVQNCTGAGIGCGACWEYVQELWNAHRRNIDRKKCNSTKDKRQLARGVAN